MKDHFYTIPEREKYLYFKFSPKNLQIIDQDISVVANAVDFESDPDIFISKNRKDP